MRLAIRVGGIVLCLGVTACGASKRSNLSVAKRSLLQAVNLPAGFSPALKPLLPSTQCTAAPYFRQMGAAVAVKGYERKGVAVLQATGVFDTAASAERALTTVSSPTTEACVERAAAPASVVIEKPRLQHLGFSVHDIRYIISYSQTYYIDTVIMREGRTATVLGFVGNGQPAPAQLISRVIPVARNHAFAALAN